MTTLVDTRYGEMECFVGDSVVSRALELYGEWAQLELEILQKILKPGDTVLDVGSFLGTHTLGFARMVGPAGKVHAFEPRGPIRAVLQSNVERNRLSQVEVHGCALGVSQSNLIIASVDKKLDEGEADNFGGLALESAVVGTNAKTESISILPMDSFGFERVDLVKIDAEGMEAEVILGGARTIARHRPLIFAECNDLEKGSGALRACLALDYVVFGTLSDAYNPSNYRSNQENIFQDASEASLLAIPRERAEAVLAELAPLDLAAIDSLDALALLLLHKSQYPEEALACSSAAQALGIKYPSPLSRILKEQLAREASALHARVLAAEDLAEQYRQSTLAAEALAERYRPSSLAYWWQRFFGARLPSVRP